MITKFITGLLFILSLCSLSFAQEDGISVVFRYNAGESLKYNFTGVGNGTIEISSNDTMLSTLGLNTAFPIDLAIELNLSATTLSVSPEGDGTFSIQLDDMDILAGLFGQKFRFALDSQSLKIYNNQILMTNQSMDSIGQPNLMGKPMTITVSNKGKLIDLSSPYLEELNNNPGFPKLYMDSWKNQVYTFLPDKPLKAGDYWECTTKFDSAGFFKSSQPIEQIYSFKVLGTRELDGENTLVIQTQSDSDLSDLSFSMDTETISSSTVMGKFSMKFQTCKSHTEGELLVGIDSGKLKKMTGNQSLTLDMEIGIPSKTDTQEAVSIKIDGVMNTTMELR